MPEIKHTFTAGKMNKDLDERLVPNGQYREALNVQVRTTDSDSDGVGNAGVIQNIEGNVALENAAYKTTGYDGSVTKMVASVSDEKNDVAYFFAAAPLRNGSINSLKNIGPSTITNAGSNSEVIWVDSIMEIKTVPDTSVPIFVDKFAVTGTYANAGSPSASANYNQFTVSDGTKYRIGMVVYAQKTNGDHLIFNANGVAGAEITNINGNTITLEAQQSTALNSDCAVMKFIHKERVLEFNHTKLITGVNVLDNLLMFTDGESEPKKINITRAKAGTNINGVANDGKTHTKLFVTNPLTRDIVEITELENVITSDIKKENITVIKKKPITPPILDMKVTGRESIVNFPIEYYKFVQADSVPVIPEVGTSRVINIGTYTNDDGDSVVGILEGLDLRVNDVLIFTDNTFVGNPVVLRARITDINTSSITVEMLFIDNGLSDQNVQWTVRLEQTNPLFETKFGRFAYRYKYDDNEYSAFSPWSELAFLPGTFTYTPSKGFNQGMINNLRVLKITGFIPDDLIRPSDVETVEILWKTTDNANVYVVKSITREIDTEWELYTDNDINNTGSIEITSEIIERVIEENQILRGWDNVPRYAIAQEVTANRLVYGNYTQGYNIDAPIGLKQTLVSTSIFNLNPQKSVKASRSYKFGVVYGDEYGRETPVISSGYSDQQDFQNATITGDVNVDKKFAHKRNRFKVQQNWNEISQEPSEWMSYAKYYVKETSSEYYNLVMDRWYEAKDGNVWLSFNSADRNKVDEESYLILKNENGSQLPVEEEAKYKILAIANEAPDYIKLDYRLMDQFKLSYGGVYTGDEGDVSNANPIKLYQRNVIETSADHFAAVGVKITDFKGIPKGRIVAEYYNLPPANITNNTVPVATYKSPWKTISRILRGTTYDDETGAPEIIKAGIVFKSKFKREEVDAYLYFTESLGGTLATDLQSNVGNVDDPDSQYHIYYKIEMADYVVENKAQFDGRFFVKIEKNTTLEARVLTSDYNQYQLSGAYKIAYITNRLNNPANDNAATLGPYNASGWNSYTTTQPNGDPTTIGNIGSQGGQAFGTYNTTEGSNSETLNFIQWWKINQTETNIFLDGLQAARTAGTEGDPANWEGSQYQGLNNQGATDGNSFDWRYQPQNYDGSESETPGTVCLLGEAVYGNDYYDTWSGSEGQGVEEWSTADTVFFPPQARFNSDSGLIHGEGADPGMYNYLILSVINNDGGNRAEFQAGDESIFKSRMQTEGQYFRFRGDPVNNIYKVIPVAFTYQDSWSDGETLQPIAVSSAQITIQSHNVTGNSAHPFKHRESIVVKFQRVDQQTGQGIIGSGVNINQWDPRGEVQHNGIGTFTIETLNAIADEDNADIALVTDRGCWETEPKSEEGLDIYYEASSAIPMKLNSLENLSAYVIPSVQPSRSTRLNVELRTGAASGSESNFLIGGPFVKSIHSPSTILVQHTPSFFNSQNPINLQALTAIDVQPENSEAIGIGLGINDQISLRRRDGLQLINKIVDHMQLLNGVAVPSTRYLDVGNVMFVYVGGNLNKQFMWVGGSTNFSAYTGLNDASQLSLMYNSRWQVTGGSGSNILPDGVFVTNVGEFYNSPNTLLTLNRQVFGGVVTTVSNINFINTTGYYKIDEEAYNYPVTLSWFNCYSFGNGVESDRIRDDFNAPQIDNGCRVSSTFLEYGEETISSGLIHSGLYNSISSVNNLNEFNMAGKITKNLNPAYGSIQALKTLDNNLVSFTEDKVLKVLSNKDAVFNADGNPQLVATNRVLGDATPFAGDYGISKNPESLAVDNYRMYFTDKQRGAVLRLSMDGLTPISNVGMKSYFREKLKICDTIIGSFDIVNGEYNATLNIFPSYQSTTEQPITVSFNEGGKGWVSFKSFVPDAAVSVSGKYLTAKENKVYEHYRELDLSGGTVARNNFYGVQYNSELEMIFNDAPSSIKSFKAVNYEGTQSRVIQNYLDGMDYNLFNKNGWYVDSFITDLQEGKVQEFIEKEGKWFNNVTGLTTSLSNINASELSVQGIGFPSDTNTPFGGYGDVVGQIKDKGDNP